MTSEEITRRNHDIIEARARGISWASIGRTFDLDPDHCRRILREHRASLPPLEIVSGEDHVRDWLEQKESVIGELALVAVGTSHDGTRLGAINSRARHQEQRFEFLQLMGLAPRFQTAAQDRNVEAWARAIIDAFERNNIPPEIIEDVVNTSRLSWERASHSQLEE